MSIKQVSGEANTFTLNGDMTDDDVKFINSLPNGAVVRIGFTNQATPERLFNITNSVNISVYGSLDYTVKKKYQSNFEKHVRTEYSPRELAVITNKIKKLTDRVDKNWSDLKKAMFCAVMLAREVEFEHKESNNNELVPGTDKVVNVTQTLRCLDRGRGVCAGYAMVYHEMLHNLGIQCEYQEKVGDHAWNVITINGKRIPVDITWLSNKMRDDKCSMSEVMEQFGCIPPTVFYSDNHHNFTTDKNGKPLPPNKIDKEENWTTNMDCFNVSDPTFVQAFNEINAILNQREFELKPHDDPELLFAYYPEIATGGPYKAYMIQYNGADIKNSEGDVILQKGQLVLTYVPDDIAPNLAKFSKQKIIDAMTKNLGFIDAENHKALYDNYRRRIKPQSMTFMGSSRCVNVFENKGSVINGLNAYSALYVDKNASGKAVVKSEKIYSEMPLTSISDNTRQVIADNLFSDSSFANASKNGGYIGRCEQNAMGKCAVIRDPRFQLKSQERSKL